MTLFSPVYRSREYLWDGSTEKKNATGVGGRQKKLESEVVSHGKQDGAVSLLSCRVSFKLNSGAKFFTELLGVS